jgi:hypothetical protein
MVIQSKCERKSKQRQKEELSTTLAAVLFYGAHHRAEALVEIQFLILFFCIFP